MTAVLAFAALTFARAQDYPLPPTMLVAAQPSVTVPITAEQAGDLKLLDAEYATAVAQLDATTVRKDNAELRYVLKVMAFKNQLKLGDEYEWDAANKRFVRRKAETKPPLKAEPKQPNK